MKSKSLILMVVSLGFGLIAAIGISQVMGNNKQTEPVVERAQVLVAATALKHGDDLTEENVKIEHWPAEVIPEDAARSFDQIQHMKIATRLSKSLPILMSDVANPKDINSFDIPKGYKLVAIKVSAEDSFNGLLQPGDRVDVIGIVTIRAQAGTNGRRTQSKTVSETFLKNIEVYAVDGRLRSAPREGGNSKNSIVGILVTEKQSEMIALVQKVARLKIVMRGDHESDEDWEEFADYSQFYESVFGKSDADNESDSDAEVEPAMAMHNMKIYEGSQVQEYVFQGNKRLSRNNELEESLEDSAGYDHEDEGDSDFEEDQYRGE